MGLGELMAAYGESSEKELLTACEPLQKLFRRVLQHGYDHKILKGYRGEIEQDLSYTQGKSQKKWPSSSHNINPSNAVDAVPWIKKLGSGLEIPWPPRLPFLSSLSEDQRKDFEKYRKCWMQFAHFAGYVKGVADEMGIPIRLGVDWDSDFSVIDNSFDDAPHVEIRH